uniref:RRM domain-containing protein n=1 Tax=Panagrellus redivivus TaxID=6233 RepID=A0A7E4VBH4_PANRE
MATHKWGVVISVTDRPNLFADVRGFFDWLLPELTRSAEDLQLIRQFAAKPSFMYRCEPEEREEVERAYEQAEKEHPDVIFVFHLLPYRNSKEFNWLKEFSKKHWQIGQGILFDNVVKHFDGSPLADVFANMNQYMSRRMAEVSNSKRPENKGRVLYVNSTKSLNNSLRPEDIADSVRLVLHNQHLLEGDHHDVSTIIASGYPPCYTSCNLASLFDKLTVQSVQPIRPNACFIRFQNETQAVQALLNRHGYDLGAGYYLDLQPTTGALKKRMLDAKDIWTKLGVADKFPYA